MRNVYNFLANTLEHYLHFDARYFLRGGFWLAIAQGTTVIFSLITAILFTHFLSESSFGVYRYIVGLAVLIGSFSLTGMGQAILQATSRGYDDYLRSGTRMTLFWSIGIILISLVGTIYYYVKDNEVLALGCFIIALLHPLGQLSQNTISYLYGKMDFKTGSLFQVYKSVFVSGTSIFCILITQNIIILLSVYFSSQAIAGIVGYLFYRPTKLSKKIIPAEALLNHNNYARHSSYQNFFVLVATRIDTLLVFQFLGSASLALYTIIILIPEHVRSSFKNLQTLILPRYTQHNSLELLRKSIPKRSLQFFLILMAVTVTFIFLTPLIYPLLFPKYTEAIPYVQLLALSFPSSIYLLPFGALQALQMEKRLYIFNLTTSAIQIVLLAILVATLGMLGGVISIVLTQYSKTLLSYVLLYKK